MANLRIEIGVGAPTVEDHIEVLEPSASPTKTKLCRSGCIVLSVLNHQSRKKLEAFDAGAGNQLAPKAEVVSKRYLRVIT